MSTTAVAAPAGDSAPAAVKVSKRPSGKTASTKKAEHPTYREMISCALGAMKERKGTSRQKIQKYIVDTYKLDLSASNSHLKRALTSGVEKGAIESVFYWILITLSFVHLCLFSSDVF